MTRNLGRTSLLALSVMAGCIDSDPIVDTEADFLVAGESVELLASSAGLAHLTSILDVTDRFDVGVGSGELRRRAIAAVVAKLDRFDCLELTTDDETYVELGFNDACNSLLLDVQGSIVANVYTDEARCEVDACVSWVIEGHDYQVRVLGHPLTSGFQGKIFVDIPLERTAPLRWTTNEDYQINLPFGTVSMISDVEFRVDDMTDCIEMDLDAELNLVDGRTELVESYIEEQIGTVVISAVGVQRCANRCPSKGEVFISYGNGNVLQWRYGEGASTRRVTVRGPRGEIFVQALPCLVEAM